jgi:hypothetical protein
MNFGTIRAVEKVLARGYNSRPIVPSGERGAEGEIVSTSIVAIVALAGAVVVLAAGFGRLAKKAAASAQALQGIRDERAR